MLPSLDTGRLAKRLSCQVSPRDVVIEAARELRVLLGADGVEEVPEGGATGVAADRLEVVLNGGAVTLAARRARPFTDEEAAAAAVLADIASVALAGARRAEQTAAANRGLVELSAALGLQPTTQGVCDMLARAVRLLVPGSATAVWLREGEDLHLVAHARAAEPDAETGAVGERVQRSDVAALTSSRRPLPAPTPLGAAPDAVACPIGEDEANVAVLVVEPAGELGASELTLLQSVTDQALLAISNQQMLESREHVFLETVKALGAALDAKDEYTQEHAEAMVSLAVGVAERLGLADEQLRDVAYAAALHDIGKIGIPGSILQKPGPLTEVEYEIVKQHTVIGARILEPVAGLHGARDLVIACHEHWDGSGYPSGLRGERSPLGARIILACDAYGAITETRPYREGRSQEQAVAELRRCAGSQFDPGVVEALVGLLDDRRRQANGASAAPVRDSG